MRFPIALKPTFNFGKFELGAILSVNLFVSSNQEEILVATFLLIEHEFRRYKFKTLFLSSGIIICPDLHRDITYGWVTNDDILKLSVTGSSVGNLVGPFGSWDEFITEKEETIKPKFYLDIIGV